MREIDQARSALRSGQITLSGTFELSEGEEKTVDNVVDSSRNLVAALLSGEEPKKSAKLEKAFMEGLFSGIMRTIKAVRRGVAAGFVDMLDTSDVEVVWLMADEYRTAVDFVLSLSKLGSTTFARAATITPYWNGDLIAQELSTENIVKYLGKKGVEMTTAKVDNVFTKRVKLHFAVKNIKDPLEACLRYVRGELLI
ncbi:MAG: hypothetical protein O3B47_02105 [bacterium]|nr:hypothetical protein [bacterium]